MIPGWSNLPTDAGFVSQAGDHTPVVSNRSVWLLDCHMSLQMAIIAEPNAPESTVPLSSHQDIPSFPAAHPAKSGENVFAFSKSPLVLLKCSQRRKELGRREV